MVDTAPDVRAARSARPRLVVSVTASVDGRVTLNRASRLLDEAAGKCGTPSIPTARTGCSQHATPYLVAGDGPVDLGDALRTMKDQLGATCVVSEAGGGLNGALLRSGLVDELHLMLLPSLVGGLGTPTTLFPRPAAHGEHVGGAAGVLVPAG